MIGKCRVGHILNPKKGLLNEIFLKISITTSKAVEADAFTTALFVFDIDKANYFFTMDEHLKYFAILSNGNFVKNY